MRDGMTGKDGSWPLLRNIKGSTSSRSGSAFTEEEEGLQHRTVVRMETEYNVKNLHGPAVAWQWRSLMLQGHRLRPRF